MLLRRFQRAMKRCPKKASAENKKASAKNEKAFAEERAARRTVVLQTSQIGITAMP
jgi:hypothetical protein